MATAGAGPEWIEIIEADASVFGAGSPLPSGGPRRARVRRGSRSAAGFVVLALLAGAAFVGLRLQPWHRGPHALSFPTPSTASAGDGHWVFDTPPGTLVGAGTGNPAPGTPGASSTSDFTGYVFADPDASIGFAFNGSSSGRWALFSTRTYDNLVTGGTSATVQGVPAVISTQDVDAATKRIDVEFGPLAGRLFDVTTEHLTMAEAMRFAEVVGLHDGTPTIADDRSLAGMRPVTSATDLIRVYGLLSNTGVLSVPQTGLVFATYRAASGLATVASIPFAGDNLMRFLHLLFPGGVERTVHGVTGLAAADALPSSTDPSSRSTVVMWQQDGRLVQVSGSGTIDETVALAETVRTATAAEWAAVVDVAATTPNPVSQTIDPSANGVILLDGDDPASGDHYTVSAQLADKAVSSCVVIPNNTSCAQRTLPLAPPYLQMIQDGGLRFVVAVVPADIVDHAYIRITYDASSGKQDEIEMLADRGEILPGPATAALVPDDAVSVEMWNSGQLVGALDGVSRPG